MRKSIIEVATDIGALVEDKNEAYGNAFAKAGDFLRILYPDGIKPEQYTDMLLLVRIFDKQMRIANRRDAFGESPYQDIAGYGTLGVWIEEVAGEDPERENEDGLVRKICKIIDQAVKEADRNEP